MQFAIISVTLLLHGFVSAVHHDELIFGSPTSLMQTKYKRSVYGGFPYAYGYHMPIEPMPMAVDRTFERAHDSYLEPYQSAAFWDRYYHHPATTPMPTAYPRPDVVYRTLMQRAADSNADASDRGGNVAIQLTANLVYGYRPSDVAEPVAFPRVEASVRFARPDGALYADEPRRPAVPVPPQSSGAAESAVIVVALSSDKNDDDDAAAAGLSASDYDRLLAERRWMQGPAYSTHDDVSAAAAAAADASDQLLNEFFKNLMGPNEPSETAAEADQAENEIDNLFAPMTTTAEPTDDVVPDLAISSAGGDVTKCDEYEENCGGSESATTENRPEIVEPEIPCDEDDEDCGGSQSTTTENVPQIVESEIPCDEDDEDCGGSQSTTTENVPEIVESDVSCDEDDDDCSPTTTTESTTPTGSVEEGEIADDGGTIVDMSDKWILKAIEIPKDTNNEIESAEPTIAPVQEEDELQNSNPIESEPEIKVTSFYDDDD